MNMEWISVKDRLPEPPEKEWGTYMNVLAAWGSNPENIAEMKFVVETVRGKVYKRFKWNGKLSPWIVTHWMPLPEPPKK